MVEIPAPPTIVVSDESTLLFSLLRDPIQFEGYVFPSLKCRCPFGRGLLIKETVEGDFVIVETRVIVVLVST